MKSILPSPSDLWSSAIPDGQEPLAYLVGQIVPVSRFQPSPPLPAIWGVLSALSRVSFDPNGWVKKPFPMGAFPALTAILKCAEVGRERRHHREWPLALGEFSPVLLLPFKALTDETRYDDVDAEWLAAVVLAAGADPWIDKDAHHGLGSAFGMAAGLNLAGLVERMWAVEKNRPSLQQLSEVVCASPVFPDKGERTWLEHAMMHDDPALTVWLLRQGVRPLPDRPHPAVLASHTGQLKALKEHGCWPSTAAEQRSLETAWRARLKKGDLTASQFTAFQEVLSIDGPVSELEQDQKTLAAFFEQKVAGPKWNSTGYAVAPSNIGIAAMAMEAEILRGPMAGRWNRLAAEVFSHMRQGHARGVLAWDLRRWAPSAAELSPGSLKAVLGREWRDGVSFDGLLALGILGMSDIAQRGACASLHARPLDKQPLIDVAAEALGVRNVNAWAEDHADSAIAWTELATKGASAPACNRMQDVWATALTRHPFWLTQEPALSLRLLQALVGNFKAVTLTTLYDQDPNRQVKMLGKTSSLGTVIEKVWPGISNSPPPVFSSLSDEKRALAVEIALMLHTPEWLNALKEGFRELSPEELQRVEVFAAYAQKNWPTKTWDGRLLSSALREMQLDVQLPEPTDRQAKLRF